MLRYRLCEKNDCELWIKLNREFMDEELTNPGAMEFYKAIGYQPADMKFYVKYPEAGGKR